MNTETLIEFVARFQKSTTNRQVKFNLGEIESEAAAALLALTGTDVSGFMRIVDNFGIRHAFKKHGHPATEKPRGQIAIEPGDFELIETTISAAELIVVEVGKKGLLIIRYEREFEDFLLVYAEELRIGQRELAFQTLYKRKIRKP